MVANVGYDEAFSAFDPRVREAIEKNRAGTSAPEIAAALERFDIQAASRRTRVGGLDEIGTRSAILSVDVRKNGREWHWIVYDEGVLLDPGSNLETQAYKLHSVVRIYNG